MARKSKQTTPAQVIAITSGKGGVGKTHTSINLGAALVQLKKKVLILDADLGLANVNVLLGFTPKATIHELVAGKATIDEIIVNDNSGIDIIPATSGIQEVASLDEPGRQIIMSALDELAFSYDYIIVDTAAGIGKNVMFFNAGAGEIIVVINPEPTSITDAYAVIKVLSQSYGRKDFSILCNSTPRDSNGKVTFAKLIAATDRFLNVSLRYRGEIGHDMAVQEAVRTQRPFLEVFPSSRASMDVMKLAKNLIEEPVRSAPSGGMQFFFHAMLSN